MALRYLLLILFALVRSPALPAQTSSWPAHLRVKGHRFFVVTVNEPNVQKACIPLRIDTTALTCRSPIAGSQTVFAVADVLTLYEEQEAFGIAKFIAATAGYGAVIALLFVNPILGLATAPVAILIPLLHHLEPAKPHRMRQKILYQRATP